jgi:hypothetical protein
MFRASQNRVGKTRMHTVVLTVLLLAIVPVSTLHYDLGMLRIPEDSSDAHDTNAAKVAAARVSALSEFPFTLGTHIVVNRVE